MKQGRHERASTISGQARTCRRFHFASRSHGRTTGVQGGLEFQSHIVREPRRRRVIGGRLAAGLQNGRRSAKEDISISTAR